MPSECAISRPIVQELLDRDPGADYVFMQIVFVTFSFGKLTYFEFATAA